MQTNGGSLPMNASQIVVKNNRPLRFFAMGMVVLIVAAHLTAQIDLRHDWVFWIMLAMSANAIQATFTGFCPMFKNARGECVTCGVTCDAPACTSRDTDKQAS